jgi:hypothetical protein
VVGVGGLIELIELIELIALIEGRVRGGCGRCRRR